MLTILGLGVYGVLFYMLLIGFAGIHNFHVTLSVARSNMKSKRKKRINAGLALFASLTWSLFFFINYFGNLNIYSILFLGYVCAVVYNMRTFSALKEKKGILTKILLFYNILGISAVFMKMLSLNGIDFTGGFSFAAHTITLSHSLFEMINFFFLQIFYPSLFIPPLLINAQSSQKFLSALENKLVKAFAAYTAGFTLVAGVVAVVLLASFSHIPVFTEDYQISPMKFGAKVNSFANEAEEMQDWETLLEEEITLSRELELDYMDFYVDMSYVEDDLRYQQLKNGLARVREEGLGIIAACMGDTDWFFNPASLKAHNSVMQEQALALAALHPDYVLVVVEPFARHNSMMLQHPVEVEEWVDFIDETALKVKSVDENIKVGVTIAAAEAEGITLFQSLLYTNVDAVGIDVHPFHADMIDVVFDYGGVVPESCEKEVWVFEFGVETHNFGEEVQARYMSYLPQIASQLGFWGVVQYDLLDNPQSQLGLQYTNGEKKLGFYGYKNAIRRIRGEHFDFSTVIEEKQEDNGVFILIGILLALYVVVKRIR